MGLFLLILLLILIATGSLLSVLKVALGVALGVFLGVALLGAFIGWRVRRALLGAGYRRPMGRRPEDRPTPRSTIEVLPPRDDRPGSP